MRLIDIPTSHYESLEIQEKFVNLAGRIQQMRASFKKYYHSNGTIWNISSTSKGGGVAEMIPNIILLLRELGAKSEWAVLDVKDAQKAKTFFELTKHLHNNIHASGEPLSKWKDHDIDHLRSVFEQVNEENAKEFLQICNVNQDTDLIIVHDPQPSAMITFLKKKIPNAHFVWRCHIGVDVHNDATKEAWQFLAPYIKQYDATAYSAKEYIQHDLNPRSYIIHPGISPTTAKNMGLSAYQIMQVLMRARIAGDHHKQYLVDPFFEHSATIYKKERIHFLHRPVVSQISRWDRLKGWIPLMKAFIHLKENMKEYSKNTDYMSHKELVKGTHNSRRHYCTLKNSCLVLAGPDPKSIEDDPEGLETLQEIKDFYDQLPKERQEDIMIVELPMDNTRENALIVNAIQRASYIIVQNSIKEGFGLTATEALYKGVCFVGTYQAVGLRTQVRDGIDGLLVRGDPSDFKNVALTLNTVLGDVELHDSLAVNGQKRANENFLNYSQLEKWLKLGPEVMNYRSKS